jgi:hypothetical protein
MGSDRPATAVASAAARRPMRRAERLVGSRGELDGPPPAERRLRDALEVALGSSNLMVREHSPTRLLAALAANRLEAGDADGAAAALERGLEISAAVAAGFGECVSCSTRSPSRYG